MPSDPRRLILLPGPNLSVRENCSTNWDRPGRTVFRRNHHQLRGAGRDLNGLLPGASLDDRGADEEVVLLAVDLGPKMQTISNVNRSPQIACRSLREIAVGRDEADFCRHFIAQSGRVPIRSDRRVRIGFIGLPHQQHDRIDAF